ncbi:MAG: hypothetical protein ACR2MQ_16365 [Gemmatimonadaceae bacterium]
MYRYVHAIIVLGSSILWTSTALHAQANQRLMSGDTAVKARARFDTIQVQPQTRVRVRAYSDGWHIGRVAEQRPDTLVLRRCEACEPEALSLRSIGEVDVSRGRHFTAGHAIEGALAGTALGIAAGMLYTWQSERNCRGDLCGLAALSIPYGAAAGFGGGLIVGAIIPSERWQQVWPH